MLKNISLTPKEGERLEIVLSKAHQVVIGEALTKRVWEDTGVRVGRCLDPYIFKLKKKVGDDKTI